jgi:protein TonB
MYKFLSQNIKYPNEAMKNKNSGKVFLRFIVEKDGTLSDIQLMKGIGYGFDLEAIRVVKTMPNWIPGMNANKAVRCYYNLPISFSIK